MMALGLGLLRLGTMPHAVVASTAGWLLILVSAVIVTLYVPLLLAAMFWGLALRVEPVAASFASACMGFSAVAYAVVLPVVVRWIGPHHSPQTDRSEKPLLRRLAAIAFLDVAGYSRLMGVDEETTLCEWLALRCMVIEPRVRSWRGRIVNRAGDGVLIEFRSALDAFHWAVDVQNAIVSRVHAGVPMQVRIAVHLGDVIVDAEGELQGDRVNTVARLQAYAEPGGIIVSQAMANEVLGKTAADFLDLGELCLRNISRPVHAFRLRTPGVSPWPVPDRSSAGGDVSGPVDAMLILSAPRPSSGQPVRDVAAAVAAKPVDAPLDTEKPTAIAGLAVSFGVNDGKAGLEANDGHRGSSAFAAAPSLARRSLQAPKAMAAAVVSPTLSAQQA